MVGLFQKPTFKTADRLLPLFPVVGISYLLGLLMNDILFDISTDDIATRTYYCELMRSFSDIFGSARILFPAAVCGVCQLLIAWKSSNQDILSSQRWVIMQFSFIGIPLIGVSLSLCDRECSITSENPTWSIRPEILTIHLLMLALFLSSLLVQVQILLSYLDSST